jgi:hypothetical protein
MAKNTVFIHTNNKQLLGAKVAHYAIFKHLNDKDSVDVRIINVDNLSVFKDFSNKKYLRKGTEITYNPQDLQSFTLSRFMPPQLMNYEGKAVVIDPDIFPLIDINQLFNIELQNNAIACCPKKDDWDTSVMLMDCSQLKHWRIENIINELINKKTDYVDWMSLKMEKNILPLPREWNSLDSLSDETKLLHTTQRLTQPWKTGLPIDFTRNKLPKLFGLIPREWVLKIRGKYPSKYQAHPDKNIERFFIQLIKESLENNFVSREFIKKEIEAKHVRPDLLPLIDKS